jgi:hypothetical protein
LSKAGYYNKISLLQLFAAMQGLRFCSDVAETHKAAASFHPQALYALLRH